MKTTGRGGPDVVKQGQSDNERDITRRRDGPGLSMG